MLVAGSTPSVRTPNGSKPRSSVPSLLPNSTTRSSGAEAEALDRVARQLVEVLGDRDEVEVTYT